MTDKILDNQASTVFLRREGWTDQISVEAETVPRDLPSSAGAVEVATGVEECPAGEEGEAEDTFLEVELMKS